MRERVLTVGLDAALLESRAAILSTRYEASTARPEEAMRTLLNDRYDLLMVCYSVPPEKASQLIHEAHAELPKLCIIRLLSVSSPPVKEKSEHRSVLVDHRPETWMRVVDELLHPPAKS